MYRCATVTESELAELATITNVIRLGRVQEITESEIVLERGTVPTSGQTLHIDCTADGLERRPIVPVFSEGKITLQTVRTCQQVFSAAFIAHVEASYVDPVVKNELTTVIPHPNTDLDWMRVTMSNALNSARWRENEELAAWLQASRLDAFSELRTLEADADEFATSLLQRAADAALPALGNLQRFLAES